MAENTEVKHLYGKYADILVLGGASIPIFLGLMVMPVSGEFVVLAALIMMWLANFVNHPHFAHSYQIFYGSWPEVLSQRMEKSLRHRWWLAGVMAPLALFVMLLVGAYRWFQGDGLIMAWAITAMGALVGWHYVKQGFGMAMVDAALKKKYWTPAARKALLLNAYVCWAVAWCLFNVSGAGQSLWGVLGVRFTVPFEVLYLAMACGVVSTCWCSIQIYRCLSAHKRHVEDWSALPVAGVVAYFVSLYCWTVFSAVNPAFIYFIPFFHSLQYLAVVYRYKSNEIKSEGGRSSLSRFAVHGLILGALGFWLVPAGLDYFRSGELPKLVGYTSVLLAAFWLFINVHHYFIDNVLWRQGNPKVSQHLFGAKKI